MVKGIDVLGHKDELVAQPLLEGRQGKVTRVRLAGAHHAPALAVPPPHRLRIPLESAHCCQILGLVVPPQPPGAPVRRDATLRGDPCAGERHHGPGLRDGGPGFGIPLSLVHRYLS